MISTVGDLRELNAASTSLYESLVQPLLPFITGKELIIVPHDVLHYLPFQALMSADGRYLIEEYPINYLSSASLLRFTKEKSRTMGERVLAFGNPDLNDPAMSLRFAGIEAKEIKNLYPESTIYLEKEATEERAKTLSGQNDIIHFASHAELNENDPLSSALLLAKSDKEDGRLEVSEIFGMDLKASLVVLSACETGLGKLSSGDESGRVNPCVYLRRHTIGCCKSLERRRQQHSATDGELLQESQDDDESGSATTSAAIFNPRQRQQRSARPAWDRGSGDAGEIATGEI
ncbi:MAG: CHAT domain-containing protein [Deltaproteobacteria bacterium]|nr:CHAT domain-containing protein [Deltaproteobacteria bacterium]